MFIDILCAIFIGTGFYLGYSKGIIKSVFGILSILLAILVTLKFSHWMIGLVEKLFHVDPRLHVIIGFVATFLLVAFTIRLLGRGFEKVLESAQINFINQLAGGIVSTLLTIMLFSSIIWFFDRIRLIGPETKSASISYPYLQSVPEHSRWLMEKCKPIFIEFWQKTNEALEQAEPVAPENTSPKQ